MAVPESYQKIVSVNEVIIIMKKAYYIYLIGFAVLNFLFFASSAQCKRKLNTEEAEILKKFSDYRLLSIKDLDSMTAEYFSKKFSGHDPAMVKGDFNGDSNQDFAVLLRKKDDSKSTKLLVLLCSKSERCIVSYELDVTNNYDSVYLTSLIKGSVISQTEAIDIKPPTSPLKLKHTGVRITYFGKAEVILYWDEKTNQFETIQTAD